jgi:hypothetical protein
MYSIGLELVMKPYQYFLLSLTLIIFLLSLAGHYALEEPLCCRLDQSDGIQENSKDQSDVDVCLVCQLQMGVYVQTTPSCLAVEKVTVLKLVSSPPFEFVSQLLRPPILF